MRDLNKCKSATQNVTADACAPRREIHCNCFPGITTWDFKGKHLISDAGRLPCRHNGPKIGTHQSAGKKKPEILRSRAKSTKGGGWRRQPWHVGMNTASGSTATHRGLAPRRYVFNIHD